MDEMFADPQVKHLRMARAIEHPKLGTQEVIGQAINMSRTTVEHWTATPEQGEHTDAVLKDAGYDDKAIASFRQRGVI
jgi:formyl-CoA transferase